MKTFKTKFNCGDEVNVRCDEAGMMPFFEAVICEARVGKDCRNYYTVIEPDGMRTGDYTEDWLTLRIQPPTQPR